MLATPAFADSFTCYRFVDGKPAGGYIAAPVSSKDEAARKAVQEYKDMGKQVDYVECEY